MNDDDEVVDTRQKYINYIRDIRDKDEKLFEKIKKLPKKIKTAKKYNNENGVITFLEKEDLKNLFLLLIILKQID